jgi:excisionase family DNA binding protein
MERNIQAGCVGREALTINIGASPPSPDKLLAITDAAVLLRISPRTCRAWCETGELPAFKIGAKLWRVWESELRAYLQDQRRRGGGA